MTQPPEASLIDLPDKAPMAEYQRYIAALEARMGWSEVDLVHTCFLMGEEVGELFKSVRRVLRFYDQAGDAAESAERLQDVREELADVLNYLLAVANRLDIDLEGAFRDKNAKNQLRNWHN